MANPATSVVRSAIEGGVELLLDLVRRRLPKSPNPFVVGIHEPMRSELTLRDLPVTGSIPAGLDGRYLKIGANPAGPALPGHNWFMGDGMVHGLAIGDGVARWYRNRWIGSRVAASALGRPAAPGPRNGRNDTVNTNVAAFGGRVFALVEAGSFPVELSDTLEEQRYNPFDGTLHGSFSGHPHLDPVTGEAHAIAYDGRVWNSVRHVVVSATGRVVRDIPIPVEHGPCIHDCALTARFVVVLDLPVTFSMRTLLRGHRFPFRWNEGHRARVGLLPRHGGGADIVWCDVEPCFVFHVANAFDRDDGRVVLDVVAYPTMFASAGGDVDAVGRFERWTLDPSSTRVERRVIDPAAQEFPRIDERRFGRSYRYAYTVAVPADGNTQLAGATTLYKHDLETGARRVHEFGRCRVPGEFVFVPTSPDADEDDGWLVGFVIDTATQTTDFAVLDARSFEAAPVATVRLPHRIPPGFHGNWFPASARADAPSSEADGAGRTA